MGYILMYKPFRKSHNDVTENLENRANTSLSLFVRKEKLLHLVADSATSQLLVALMIITISVFVIRID